MCKYHLGKKNRQGKAYLYLKTGMQKGPIFWLTKGSHLSNVSNHPPVSNSSGDIVSHMPKEKYSYPLGKCDALDNIFATMRFSCFCFLKLILKKGMAAGTSGLPL